MTIPSSEFAGLPQAWAESLPTLLIGRIVEIDEAGQAWVDYPGNAAGAVPAESVVQIDPEAARSWIGRRVVLGFDDDVTNPPVILGGVHRSILTPASSRPVELQPDQSADALRIAAREQISLECGKSSITMRKDGKIVIKGEQIVSRATGTNRIKGGSVAIN